MNTHPAWPYVAPFLSSILALLTGYLLAKWNRSATETTKQKEDREKAEKAQVAKVSALESEVKALTDAFAERRRSADQERMQDRLKFEQDFAAVANILKEFAEAQRLLTGVATNVANHEKRLDRADIRFDNFDDALETIRGHINQLIFKAHGP